jgi:hypothetical protein
LRSLWIIGPRQMTALPGSTKNATLITGIPRKIAGEMRSPSAVVEVSRDGVPSIFGTLGP